MSTKTKTFKVFTWFIHIGMTKWLALVLKDDSMERHHMGPNRVHPDRSSCLGLSANGWLSQDQVFCTFSEQMLRSVYRTVQLVPAFTSQYTPMGVYWLIQAIGHVLLNTHFLAFSLRKTESVLENTLGKVRGTWRVKFKYITFKNWIMYSTVQYSSPTVADWAAPPVSGFICRGCWRWPSNCNSGLYCTFDTSDLTVGCIVR